MLSARDEIIPGFFLSGEGGSEMAKESSLLILSEGSVDTVSLRILSNNFACSDIGAIT